MSEYTRLLNELETAINAQRASGRAMLKSLNARSHYGAGTRRRAPDFGKPGVRHISDRGIDLCKAESQLRDLDRRGLLTKSQSHEAWARLMSLRPVEVVPLR